MSGEVLVDIDGVSKKFCRSLKRSLWYGLQDMTREVVGAQDRHEQLRREEFWAVHDVSFQLRRGECLGLIGHNGAGKTTLLRMLNGLIKPDRGRISMKGRIAALISLGAGFNPVLTGRENIYVNGAVLGLRTAEIRAKIDQIVDFAELAEFIDMPVQNYSSGMQVRLGFSIATALNPDILILDEILAVGDAQFQAKCIGRITELFDKCCVLFVSHHAHVVQMICSRAIWMSKGRCVRDGDTEGVLNAYLAAGESSSSRDVSPTVISPVVSTFHMDVMGLELDCGDSLTCLIRVGFAKTTRLGQLLLALLDASGEHVARATCELDESAPHTGEVTIRVTLHDLRLTSGQYAVKLMLFTNKPAMQLVNYVHPARILCRSRVVSKVAYQPAAECVVVN
jgi:lipopolysaccharide transport system ATP-binding protein